MAGSVSSPDPLHLHHGVEGDRAVHVGEGFGRIAQLLVHQLGGEPCLVDVQQQQFAGVGVEAVDDALPLAGGAAVDEALGGQFDAAGGAGVLAFRQRSRPAFGVGEVVDHRP